MRRALCVALLLLAGCAKLPTGGGIPTTKRVTLSFTMAQPINQGFIYLIALNPSTSPNALTTGPIPVVGPPWGNGMIAGSCQYFILWNFAFPAGQQAQIWTFANGNLFQPVFTQEYPVTSSLSPDGATLSAEIDLSEIAPSVQVAQSYQQLEVNFMTMNIAPTGNTQANKIWDALGDERNPQTINTWVSPPLTFSGTYNNATYGNIEPTGDCADPTLDITNFSIQVSAS